MSKIDVMDVSFAYEGSYDNIKLTTIEDITIAKAIIDSQKEKGEIK